MFTSIYTYYHRPSAEEEDVALGLYDYYFRVRYLYYTIQNGREQWRRKDDAR